MPGFDGKRASLGIAMRPAYELAGRPGASCLQVGRASPGVFATSQPDATRHPAYELAGAARRPAYELAGRRAASCLRVGRMPPGILLTSWLGESRRPACESAVRGTLAGAWPVLVSDSADETSHGSDMRTGRLEPKWQQHAS